MAERYAALARARRDAHLRLHHAAARLPVKVGTKGELWPVRGFSHMRARPGLPANQTFFRSHDGLLVVSSLEQAPLPGSGEPPKVGPQWLVSFSRMGKRPPATDTARVVECFAMPAFDEDNHHPGVARHLWCPVEEQYRSACECKINEVTIVDGDYAWTTEPDDCRGCEYERLYARPCPLHSDDRPPDGPLVVA